MAQFRKLTRKEREQAGRLTWYALKARPQGEYRLQRVLSEMGITAFVPSEWRWRKKSRYAEPKKTQFPAYKSIVFVGEGASRLDWYRLSEVHLIIGCLANPSTGFPRVINADDIQQVMKAATTPLFELHDEAPADLERFQPGERVRITDGILAGEVLTIREIADGVAHFKRDLLGKEVDIPVSVEDMDLEPKAA